MAFPASNVQARLHSIVNHLSPSTTSTSPNTSTTSSPASSSSSQPASKMPEQTLTGRVALVSGSCSGIGAGIIRDLSSRGATTVINYPFANLRPVAEKLSASLPSPSICVEADISTLTGPQTLVDAAVKEYGKIDIVVNNAALAVNKPFEEQTMADWDLLVNLNGRGTFLLTQAVLPHFPKPAEGETAHTNRIVNIVSISARGPPPNQTIYAGSKGMVDSFTKCWAKELPPKYRCTVNAVSPGPTRTEGFADAGPEQMKILQPIIDQTPVGQRMGEVEEIATAVGFLCEEKSRWVNGQHMIVAGGLFID